MRTNLYWIDGPWLGRLAISPRPRGNDWLEDEVRGWKQAGVDVVMSLLTEDERVDLGLTLFATSDFGFRDEVGSFLSGRKARDDSLPARHWSRGVVGDLRSHIFRHETGLPA